MPNEIFIGKEKLSLTLLKKQSGEGLKTTKRDQSSEISDEGTYNFMKVKIVRLHHTSSKCKIT